MIDQFVGICLQHRVAAIVIALLLGAFGIYAWETLSVEAYPELGDVAAQVTTQLPGLAAEEVEQLITVPLEREINGAPGLLLMRSSTRSQARVARSTAIRSSPTPATCRSCRTSSAGS